MEITIDEAELKKYVESTVNHKIDKLVDEVIQEKILGELNKKVDSIFAFYTSDIRRSIDKHVREVIEHKVEDKLLNVESLVEEVAGEIASKIKEDIVDGLVKSIGNKLLDTIEDEEYD